MECDYFQTFISAVKACNERRGTLGGEQLIFPPTEDYGYNCTPRNALTFGSMGVDGTHYAILKLDGFVSNESPVIQVGPMDFFEPYCVLGESFISYMSIACGVSIERMKAVFSAEEAGERVLIDFLKKHYDHSRLYVPARLNALNPYLRLIEPNPLAEECYDEFLSNVQIGRFPNWD